MPVKTVEIGLDKLRYLRFDINAFADIEQKGGAGLEKLVGENLVGINTIRLLLWGGLKWEEPRLSLEQVGNMISQYLEGGGELQDIGNKVMEAVQHSGLVAKPGKKEDVAEKGGESEPSTVPAAS